MALSPAQHSASPISVPAQSWGISPPPPPFLISEMEGGDRIHAQPRFIVTQMYKKGFRLSRTILNPGCSLDIKYLEVQLEFKCLHYR